MREGNANSPEEQASAEFITEFGDILKKSRISNSQTGGTKHNMDPASADFARFLRASRIARGLSKSELARQSGLSDAEIVCLENGILNSRLIPEQWLYALAEVLEEKPSTLVMVLERELSSVSPTSNISSLQLIWQKLITFIVSNKILILFFASIASMFTYLAIKQLAPSVIFQASKAIPTPIFYLALLLVLIWIGLVTNVSLLQFRGFRKAYKSRREIAVIFSTVLALVYFVALTVVTSSRTTSRMMEQFGSLISFNQEIATAQQDGNESTELIDVFYASQNIPQGTIITHEMLSTFSIPQKNVADVMFTTRMEHSLVGQTARFTLDQGTLITSSMVGSGPVEISGPQWVVQIPSGMVAATIPTNRLSLVGYGVNDGAHINVNACMLFVDVDPAYQTVLPNYTSVLTGTGFRPDQLPVLSVNAVTSEQDSHHVRVELDPTLQQPFYAVPSDAQRPRLVCQMILQDVVVMKLGNFQAAALADPNATPLPAQSLRPSSPGTVTLMVTPQDSISLNYFVYSGAMLSMTLRDPNNTSRVAAESATLMSLLTQYNISLPSKLPYASQPRVDVLYTPLLPNDVATIYSSDPKSMANNTPTQNLFQIAGISLLVIVIGTLCLWVLGRTVVDILYARSQEKIAQTRLLTERRRRY